MQSRDPVAVLKDMAARKRRFSLAELIPHLETAVSVNDLFIIVSGELGGLGLRARRNGNDVIISRAPGQRRHPRPRPDKAHVERLPPSPALPAGLERLVEEYISMRAGREWQSPELIGHMRKAVVVQKNRFWRSGNQRRISYQDPYSVFAYLAYHFPVYFIQSGHLLAMLDEKGLLGKKIRVLDIGTGPGVFPLAAIDFADKTKRKMLDLYSIEKSGEQIKAFNYLVPTYSKDRKNIVIHSPMQADIVSFEWETAPRNLDLIVFQNVLNELRGLTIEDRARIVRHAGDLLSEQGAILLVEPADLENSTGLRKISMNLVDGGYVPLGPCMFSGKPRCDPSSCWTFEHKPAIRPTRLMEVLSGGDEGFRFSNTDIKYSFAILGKERRLPDAKSSLEVHGLPLSMLPRNVGRRVDVLAAVLSGDLGGRGYLVYKICDGTARKPVYAVVPKYLRSASNETLMTSHYGDMLAFHHLLVRYNPRYNAYNLLITRNSVVRPV